MRRNAKAFTLVELVIGLAIGAVIVLMIGVISQTSIGSHERLRHEAEVYNDIFYGFNLIKHSVRNGMDVKAVSNTIIGNLTIDNVTGNFTFWANTSALIYTYTANSNTTNNTIIQNATNLTFIPTNQANQLIAVSLSGETDKVAFDFNTTVKRRN